MKYSILASPLIASTEPPQSTASCWHFAKSVIVHIDANSILLLYAPLVLFIEGNKLKGKQPFFFLL